MQLIFFIENVCLKKYFFIFPLLIIVLAAWLDHPVHDRFLLHSRRCGMSHGVHKIESNFRHFPTANPSPVATPALRVRHSVNVKQRILQTLQAALIMKLLQNRALSPTSQPLSS